MERQAERPGGDEKYQQAEAVIDSTMLSPTKKQRLNNNGVGNGSSGGGSGGYAYTDGTIPHSGTAISAADNGHAMHLQFTSSSPGQQEQRSNDQEGNQMSILTADKEQKTHLQLTSSSSGGQQKQQQLENEQKEIQTSVSLAAASSASPYRPSPPGLSYDSDVEMDKEKSTISGNDKSSENDDNDDKDFTFDPNLSAELAPELTEAVSNLNLDPPPRERGDVMQEHAIMMASQGRNIFLTGRAGTGKSWTTKQIVRTLHCGGKTVHVTAPTGMAAINVDGTTIHRWGGFGLGNYYSDFDKMIAKENRERIRRTDALIFDEVSMMSGHLYDVLECMVAIIRYYHDVKDRLKAIQANGPLLGPEEGGPEAISPEEERGSEGTIINLHVLNMRWVGSSQGGLGDLPPWGGMQLILVGDFYQLPPIPNNKKDRGGGASVLLENDELAEIEYNMKIGKQGTYAFQARAWPKSNLEVVELTKVHRQVQDDGLLDLLNGIREGQPNLSETHGLAISQMCSPLRAREDGIVPTELHSKNIDVGKKNRVELGKLPGKRYDFKSRDEVEMGYLYQQKLLRKHGLEDVSHMPYLWACAEKPNYPQRWKDAKSEMEDLEESKKRLLVEEKYEEVGPVRDKLKALEKEIADIEKEVEEKAKITSTTINDWLRNDPCAPKVADSALEIYDKVEAFQKQLKDDHAALTRHANDKFFEKGCRVGCEIELRVKAQVMLLWNLDIDAKLVNGSRGIVVAFVPPREYRRLLDNELSKRANTKKPDNNKSEEGTTPDKKDRAPQPNGDKTTDSKMKDAADSPKPSDAATPTPAGTALGVEADLMQLIINEIAEMTTEVIEKELRDVQDAEGIVKKLPLVRFDKAARLILPKPFMKEFKGCGKATRWQLPLTHAWAISIHKSQGMTIDWLSVNMSGCFSPGQAYVACSRGRSFNAMQVEGFSEREIKTSKVVQRFYRALATGEDYNPPIWADSLSAFEQTAKAEALLRKAMDREYGKRTCDCGSRCRVNMVKKDGKNRGKWFLACVEQSEFGDGHTWKWVPVVPI